MTGVATIVIGLLIYGPYRLSASRRARTAWSAAMDAGAKRSTARQIAQEAAYTGVTLNGGLGAPSAGAAAWAAAEAAAWTPVTEAARANDAIALEKTGRDR